MTHTPFTPAPYKLIPFDPVPFFLAIAGLAIMVNLLVLLGILLKSLDLDLVERVKIVIQAKAKAKGPDLSPSLLPRRPVDGAYEMNVGVGSSRETDRPSKRMVAMRDASEDDTGFDCHIWGPGGAAMREPTT
jgi:hypothetical protein